jgi:hypothetical protein
MWQLWSEVLTLHNHRPPQGVKHGYARWVDPRRVEIL